MSQSEIVMDILSAEQLQFIKDELGFNADAIRAMDDSAIDDMYDKICDIEVAETVASESGDGAYSDREQTAEEIVTLIGNALYHPKDESNDDVDELSKSD